MMKLVFPIAAALAAFASVPAQAAVSDCPLRDLPFSVDSPMMDLALSPAAKATVDRLEPELLKRMPERMVSTQAPAFSAIMSLRKLGGMGALTPERVAALDEALRLLPVTAADREARCARYDDAPVKLSVAPAPVKILLFEKMTGFRDGPSVQAAKAAFLDIAGRNGWTIVPTDKAGALTPAQLRRFDLVIWNNISGDVLTLRQRGVLRRYIEGGGGFLAVHGSGGDPTYWWDWYADTLIGARFIGHPADPQFQDARIVIEANPAGIGATLAPGWTMSDEWYSFAASPRASGAQVVATLDEATYKPVGRGGQKLAMGADHPIAWQRCLGSGRSFYSAIGHRPEVYSDPRHLRLLADAIRWAAGKGETLCRAGKQVANAHPTTQARTTP